MSIFQSIDGFGVGKMWARVAFCINLRKRKLFARSENFLGVNFSQISFNGDSQKSHGVGKGVHLFFFLSQSKVLLLNSTHAAGEVWTKRIPMMGSCFPPMKLHTFKTTF